MNEQKYIGKKDVMQMYGCESDKALRILKCMYNIQFAFKLGNRYYTTEEYNRKFFELYKGKKVLI